MTAYMGAKLSHKRSVALVLTKAIVVASEQTQLNRQKDINND